MFISSTPVIGHHRQPAIATLHDSSTITTAEYTYIKPGCIVHASLKAGAIQPISLMSIKGIYLVGIMKCTNKCIFQGLLNMYLIVYFVGYSYLLMAMILKGK